MFINFAKGFYKGGLTKLKTTLKLKLKFRIFKKIKIYNSLCKVLFTVIRQTLKNVK